VENVNKTEASWVRTAVRLLKNLRGTMADDFDTAKIAASNSVPYDLHLYLQDLHGFRSGHGVRRALIALCRKENGKNPFDFLPGKL